MNPKLKSVLQRSWTGPRDQFLGLALVCLVLLGISVAVETVGIGPKSPPPWFRMMACGGLVALVAGAASGIVGFVLSFVPAAQRPLSWVVRRRVFLFACAATLVALFYVEENWRGKIAWDRFRRDAEAQGHFLEAAKLAPPAVPDDQNFAMAPVVMSSYAGTIDAHGRKRPPDANDVVNRLDMPIDVPSRGLLSPTCGDWQKAEKIDWVAWQDYYRKLAGRTNLFPVPAQPGAPAADVLFALGKYDSTIEELRVAGRRPYSRFPLEYDADNCAAILLPHLRSMRSCANVLQLRAAAELQVGKTDQALQDVQLMLRLMESVHNEPILISHLVRIACLDLALQPVWEGLAEHRWSDTQLATLGQELKPLDFIADHRLSMSGEQAFGIGIINYVRRERTPDILLDVDEARDVRAVLRVTLAPAGWFQQDKLRYARFMSRYYVAMADSQRRIIAPEAARKADSALNGTTQSGFYVVGKELIPELSQVALRFAAAQSSVDCARTACALERYRLAHGKLPGTLEALAPQLLPEVPHDIINGQPLHYRPGSNDQYALYSIGWNEVDDGGKVVLHEREPRPSKSGPRVDLRKGDWVWCYDSAHLFGPAATRFGEGSLSPAGTRAHREP